MREVHEVRDGQVAAVQVLAAVVVALVASAPLLFVSDEAGAEVAAIAEMDFTSATTRSGSAASTPTASSRPPASMRKPA